MSAVYIEERNEELCKTVNFKLNHKGKTALHIIHRVTVIVQVNKSIQISGFTEISIAVKF